MSFDIKIVAGDLKIQNGDLVTVKNIEKLRQDIVKVATTDLGSNKIHSWYGSMISNSLIGNPLSMDITTNIAKSQLQRAIETIKELQGLQTASGQRVSPAELISYIKDISIVRSEVDLRVITINILILNRAFQTVNVAFNSQ